MAHLKTNFSAALLCYTEIKYFDWLKLVVWLTRANQSALFQ